MSFEDMSEYTPLYWVSPNDPEYKPTRSYPDNNPKVIGEWLVEKVHVHVCGYCHEKDARESIRREGYQFFEPDFYLVDLPLGYKVSNDIELMIRKNLELVKNWAANEWIRPTHVGCAHGYGLAYGYNFFMITNTHGSMYGFQDVCDSSNTRI